MGPDGRHRSTHECRQGSQRLRRRRDEVRRPGRPPQTLSDDTCRTRCCGRSKAAGPKREFYPARPFAASSSWPVGRGLGGQIEHWLRRLTRLRSLRRSKLREGVGAPDSAKRMLTWSVLLCSRRMMPARLNRRRTLVRIDIAGFKKNAQLTVNPQRCSGVLQYSP